MVTDFLGDSEPIQFPTRRLGPYTPGCATLNYCRALLTTSKTIGVAAA